MIEIRDKDYLKSVKLNFVLPNWREPVNKFTDLLGIETPFIGEHRAINGEALHIQYLARWDALNERWVVTVFNVLEGLESLYQHESDRVYLVYKKRYPKNNLK